jgi:hypothetical protein
VGEHAGGTARGNGTDKWQEKAGLKVLTNEKRGGLKVYHLIVSL